MGGGGAHFILYIVCSPPCLPPEGRLLSTNVHLFADFQCIVFLPKKLMFTLFWLNIFITIWRK